MSYDEIVVRLRNAFPDAEEVKVVGEGNKIDVTVVSAVFSGLRPVQKQQKIYACLNDLIASGELHAVSMRTLTPEEWQRTRMFG